MYLTAKINESETYGDETTKYVHKIFSSLQILDGNPYIECVDKFIEGKNETKEYTIKEKHWALLISLDDKYYDGVSITYFHTFKQRFDLPRESICSIRLLCKKQLNKVMIKKISTNFPIILNDLTQEAIINGIYEYKFIYNDSSPWMEFPECLSCNNLDLSIITECNQDPSVEVDVKYDIILLNESHYMKTTVCYNVIPTNDPQIIIALGSLWLRDVIFDYNLDIFTVAGDQEYYKIQETYERESSFKKIIE